MLSFGLPPDAVAWATLACALLTLVVRLPRLDIKPQLIALCACAFGLSLGYYFYYLGGASRIIDATAYLVEARSIATGSFSFEAPDPTASFRGRFLVQTATDPNRLAAIFPPGYPLVLASGALFGVHEFIGPLLGAGLVGATYFLTHALTGRRRDALAAAAFSTICACLRYHTAETMSHGLSALLAAVSLGLVLQLQRQHDRRRALLLGLCLGLLLATRQLTGAVIVLSCVIGLLYARDARGKSLTLLALGAAPGLALLLAHQDSITGDLFTSAQTRYYALADGPPGCFGLGLGKGCHFEHADVVAKHGGGLSLKWMGLNTLHRFHFHAMDVAHFEPLMLIPLGLLARSRALPRHKKRKLAPLGVALFALPAAYSLFYFAGSYPAGGARFFSELLPIWHALLAWGLCRLRLLRVGLALSFFGFAIHSSFSHGLLSQRSFGPDCSSVSDIETLLERAGAPESPPAVVFFETAHEFNTGVLASKRYIAARRTHDAREAELVERLGASGGYVYSAKGGRVDLSPLASIIRGQFYELDFEFPALTQKNLWVHPEHVPHKCISRGRALALHPTTDSPSLAVHISIPASTTPTLTGLGHNNTCVSIRLPHHPEPRSRLLLDGQTLSKFSHIDRLTLTLTHP